MTALRSTAHCSRGDAGFLELVSALPDGVDNCLAAAGRRLARVTRSMVLVADESDDNPLAFYSTVCFLLSGAAERSPFSPIGPRSWSSNTAGPIFPISTCRASLNERTSPPARRRGAQGIAAAQPPCGPRSGRHHADTDLVPRRYGALEGSHRAVPARR